MGLKLKSTNGTGSVELNAPDNHNINTSFTLPTSNFTGGEWVLADGNGNVNIDSGTLYVDAVNNRVGVGTATPAVNLDVDGTIAADGGYYVYNATNDGLGIWYNPGATGVDQLTARVNGADRLTIDSSGKVGIGTSTPNYELHVHDSGTGTVDSRIHLTNGDTGTGGGDGFHIIANGSTANYAVNLLNRENGPLALWTNNSQRLTVDSSGRVLVGTTTAPGSAGSAPYALLQIEGNTFSGTGPGSIALRSGTAAASIGAGGEVGQIAFAGNDNEEFALIGCEADFATGSGDHPGRLVFKTTADSASSPTDRMRITSGGFLKASNTGSYTGASSPYYEFNNNTANSAICQFFHKGTTNPYGLIIKFSNVAPDNNAVYFLNCVDSTSTVRFKVHSDGDCDNHDNSYGGTSDEKLKQDIVDATSQWDDIKDLRIRKFKFKSDVEAYGDEAKTLLGVVAQEAETVSPGLIKNNPDLDDEGNDLGTVTKSVRYSVLYMKAVKALQEAMERIETLETQNASFEARLAALEGGTTE